MKTVLLVDDEKEFTDSLCDGLQKFNDKFKIVKAYNGKEALKIVKQDPVDLLVTDIKMPEMDGIELIAHLHNHGLNIPVIVMSAFTTPDLKSRLAELQVDICINKPIDFNLLSKKIIFVLEDQTGHLSGISLPTFLQLIEIERKTCSVVIKAKRKKGELFFDKGELKHAKTRKSSGLEAALSIVVWNDVDITVFNSYDNKISSIDKSLPAIIMEGFKRHDEKEHFKKNKQSLNRSKSTKWSVPTPTINEVIKMTAEEKLATFQSIDGFAGAGLFTPAGEPLALLAHGNKKIKEIGVLANHTLMNAQKASLEMETGRGQMIHIEAEKAHIFVRCLNEGTHPLKSEPGKAHIHLVLIIKDDSSIGMAKLKLKKVIESLSEDFRI